MHALHYANEPLVRVRLAFLKLLQTRKRAETTRNYQKQVSVMIKHCLGNSNLTRYRSKEFSYRTIILLQNKHKSLRVYKLSGERILFINSAKLKEFSNLKNTPIPLHQSIKVHRRALVLLLCLIPCHRCEKSTRVSRNSHQLITQRDNIHARAHDTCVDPCRQDGAICSKNRKIVPYHGSTRIPRLTVSIPDYGS